MAANKKSILEKVVTFILENFFFLGTIVASIYIIVGSQTTSYTEKELLQWIISLLGLIALSLLIERMVKLDRINRKVNQIWTSIEENPHSLDDIILNRESISKLEERLGSARVVSISGGSLGRLTSEYVHVIEQLAASGTNFRFLLVTPNSVASKMLAEHVVYEIESLDAYEQGITTSMNILSRIQENFPERIKIRTQDFTPPYSLFWVDKGKNRESIYVETYAYSVPTRERPVFHLRGSEEPKLFQFYTDQFEKAWSRSSDIL